MAYDNLAARFFLDTQVVDMLEKTWTAQSVHTIPKSTPIAKAAKMLAEWNIQAAPVVDEDHHLFAVLSVVDLVKYVYTKAPQFLEVDENESMSWEDYLAKSGPLIGGEDVASLYGEHGLLKRHYVCCSITDFVEKPCLFLAGGVYKVLVQDSEGNITNIISASAMASFLNANIKHASFEEVRKKPLIDLGAVQGVVLTVPKESTVAEAVKKCNDNEISSVVIVDAEGRAVGNWSNRDISGLTTEGFPLLRTNVMEYIEKHSPKSKNVVAVSRDTTLGEALAKLVESNLHRVWILEDGKPVGCFTAQDAIRHLLQRPLM